MQQVSLCTWFDSYDMLALFSLDCIPSLRWVQLDSFIPVYKIVKVHLNINLHADYPRALFILFRFAVCIAHKWRFYLRLSLSFLHILPPPLSAAALLSFQPVNLTQLALHYISVIVLLKKKKKKKSQKSRAKEPAVHHHTVLMSYVTLNTSY